MGKRRRTNNCCLPGQQPLPVGLQPLPGQHPLPDEQESDEDLKRTTSKWKRMKNLRAQVFQARMKCQDCTWRPSFLTGNPLLLLKEWHFIWYASDSALWSLFSMSLQSLLVIVRFWEAIFDVESCGHSGPYYAVMLWRTERMSLRHIKKYDHRH